jgi:hypothetical protein
VLAKGRNLLDSPTGFMDTDLGEDTPTRRCPWEGSLGGRGRERKEAVGRLEIPAGVRVNRPGFSGDLVT